MFDLRGCLKAERKGVLFSTYKTSAK